VSGYDRDVSQSVGQGAETSLSGLSALLNAEPAGVIEEISPNDEMFVGNRIHYLAAGQGALECIRIGLLAAGREDVRSILDLPCGHGRVLRTLRAAFPAAALTASDINRDGVDFCARVFGATPVYSEDDPASVDLPGPYDLIWCGSLFTHLDEGRWHDWLDRFRSILDVGGLLVFTSHGRHTAAAMRNPELVLSPAGQPREYGITDSGIASVLEGYDESGFGFAAYPHDTYDRFGVSASSPSWVLSELGARNYRVVTFIERGWDSHQDVVGCMRVEA
jgi:SAM-dependent methyltransferase